MKRSIYLIVLLSLSLSLQAQQTDIVKLHNQATTAKEMEKTALDFSPAVDRRNMKFRDKEADSLKVKVPQRPQRASILRSATDEAASGTCGANGDNVKWTFDSSTGTLTISGTGAMADYDVDNPSYGDYKSQITRVVIETGVTRIGAAAFYQYGSLESFAVPESVTSVGDFAFDGTLWYGNQPDGCVYIGKTLYAYKGSMPENTQIDVAEGTVGIADYAFYYYCSNSNNLISVTLPGSLTSIGDYAFSYCSGLTSITIPVSVTNIGFAAFAYCNGITSFEIASANPSFLSENGVLFNKDKTALICFPGGKSGSYSVPSGVKTIGDAAFIGSGLTAVTISSSVENIGDYAFCNSSITSVTINGNSLKTIGEEAFYNTAWLNNQPYGIIYINNVLYTCKGNVSGAITVREGTVSISAFAFNANDELFSITLPESVKTIGVAAFRYSGLTSINIPNSITRIEGWTFYECINLSSITIGSSVESIGYGAFFDCGFRSITLPASLTSLEDYAFNDTGLTSVALPRNVKSIGNYAFYGGNIITSVACDALTPPVLGFQAFSPVTTYTCILDVPTTSLALYQQAPGWSDFYRDEISGVCGENLTWTLKGETLTISGTGEMYNDSGPWSDYHSTWSDYNSIITKAVIENGATSIGDGAFENCYSLTSITIPSSVTSIGDYAFFHSYSLTSIAIPNSVTSIGTGAFSECDGLTSVTIGSKVASIGDSAFSSCSSLTSVTIPNSVADIGEGAFSDCSSLMSVTIGSGVTNIKDYAFVRCSSLTSVNVVTDNQNFTSLNGILFNKDKTVLICFPGGKSGSYTIPNSVTSIGNGAFSSCSGLTSVTIPNGVISIGDDAFSYCDALTSVICYVSTPPIIDQYVFYNVNTNACTLYVPTNSIPLYQQADGWKDFYRIVTDIKEIKTAQLSIYPNPVSDRLGISGITENAVVTVLDASGKTVLQSTVAPNETIAVNRLQNGIYFVVVNGKTMKMIKKGNK